jgi:hypothetical protein
VHSREDTKEGLQAKVLTKDEVRRNVVNIARLPECWGRRIATEHVDEYVRSRQLFAGPAISALADGSLEGIGSLIGRPDV